MDEPWQSPDSDGVVFRVIWKSLAKNFRLSESEKIQPESPEPTPIHSRPC